MDEHETTVRLNKFLALHRGVSRREADDLISHGRVSVNGQHANLGARVSESDTITIDGTAVTNDTEYRYVLLNKPVDYVCSRKAQSDTPTIYSLLPPDMKPLKPVGRLDKDSSGLLLLSNDGDFAFRMTHPRFHKLKTYEITLDKSLEPLHQQMISEYGVTLEDGVSRLQLERRDDTHRQDWRVVMHEGRNRQIRRTFAALGYTVTRLHRTNFGNYSLGDIPLGSHQIVDMH